MHKLEKEISSLIARNQLRKRRVISSRDNKTYTIDNRRMINFGGNDYLGLANDDRIKQAFIKGIHEFGFGSASSPMLTGYSSAHMELEEQFAEFLGRERALLFNSGYHANLGVITTFANRNTPVIADKHIHASLIDAITLSRAPHLRFHHQHYDHAETLMNDHTTHRKLLVTESVFSMTGAITNTALLSAIANKHHATLILDDAHGFGILGEHGRGVCEHFNLHAKDLPILITPLGKAIAGMGAVVSGNHDNIEFLLQNARTYCYSTALPPSVCRATQTALNILHQEAWRLEKLRSLIHFFNNEAASRALPVMSSDMTPIKCILTGSNEQTLELQEKIAARGMFVGAIRPPTVAANTSRIRICLSASHTETEISLLLDILAEDHAHTII